MKCSEHWSRRLEERVQEELPEGRQGSKDPQRNRVQVCRSDLGQIGTRGLSEAAGVVPFYVEDSRLRSGPRWPEDEMGGLYFISLRVLRDARLKKRIRDAIDLVERAETLQGLGGIKKLAGSDRYYRIRIGDYRVGLIIEGEVVTFVRCLHRREIYRYIP